MRSTERTKVNAKRKKAKLITRMYKWERERERGGGGGGSEPTG